MKSPVRAVLFDLDGTLLDRASTFRLFVEEQYDRFAEKLVGIDREIYIRTIVELDNHGYVPKPEVYATAREQFRLANETEQALLDDFETNYHEMAIAFPRLHEMLKELSAMNLALGLVSNGTSRAQRPKIKALDIARYFGVILISEEAGVRKPAPEIYQRGMQALGSDAGSTVFVGDHPEADIGGAAKLGLKTIWMQNDSWPPPQTADATISSLNEIPPLIRAWTS